MLGLARFSVRRPVLALAGWLLVVAALAVAGSGLTDSLSPSKLVVPGTQSWEATELKDDEFGAGVLVPILLEGDPKQLDRQGPELVRRLSARADTRVMSAWDAGDVGKALRPDKDSAMVVASVARSEEQMVETYQEQIEDTVDFALAGDVRWHISGQPSIDIGMKEAAVDTARRAELLAIPILLVLLLLVTQRPVAAVVVSAFGAATVAAGFGVMTLLSKAIDIDATAIALASMSGLALGVGFSLLILRRFQEEAPEGGDRAAEALAASRTVATTGRAVLFGGTAVTVSLVLATLIAPTEILMSLGVGVLLCAMLGVGAAVVVMPAVLVLLNSRMDAGRFALPSLVTRPWERLVGADAFVTHRAVYAGAVATAVLLALALPVASLKTGPPDVTQLPADNQARIDYEAVSAAMGPGWASPFNVLVVSDTRPMTDPALLEQVDAFQARIAKDRRVAAVVGPGAFRAQTKDLGKLPKALKDSSKLLEGGKKDLGRLETGLGQAGAGAQQLQSGLRDAADGATRLQTGSGSAQAGTAKLRAGLADARAGASKIATGLGSALSGAEALRDGAAKALTGSRQLSGGIQQAAQPVQAGVPLLKEMASSVRQGSATLATLAGSARATVQSLDQAIAALKPQAAAVPEAAAALAAAQAARDRAASVAAGVGTTAQRIAGASIVATTFANQTGELAEGFRRLYDGATALQGGIAQLREGNAELAGGISRLAGGGGQLTAGLTALRNGAGQLEAGLGQLTGGAGQLASGLAAGGRPTGELASGLGQLQAGVSKFRGQLPSPKDLEELQAASPGLFDSGYFVLAAIEGAPAAQREQATFAVNLDSGGNAGQIVVTPKQAISAEATQDLAADLQTWAGEFAAQTRTDTAVGGPAGVLADFEDFTASRIWLVVAA
ncbi:MAG TPA: MMPL family transporter, partial [Baekduia sp.]|nr:MMPL family transporter [Baekduia sp.]